MITRALHAFCVAAFALAALALEWPCLSCAPVNTFAITCRLVYTTAMFMFAGHLFAHVLLLCIKFNSWLWWQAQSDVHAYVADSRAWYVANMNMQNSQERNFLQ
jgi:hypothetical protein